MFTKNTSKVVCPAIWKNLSNEVTSKTKMVKAPSLEFIATIGGIYK
jgi:hypothetical protein